jgi:hypothetical protein
LEGTEGVAFWKGCSNVFGDQVLGEEGEFHCA